MSLTVEITPDLEHLLEQEAKRIGSDPESLAQEMLRRSLSARSKARASAPRLSVQESRLLEEINQGPSTVEMDRYLTLIHRRQEESITEAELDELRAFTKRMEQLAVVRMQNVAALACLRGLDVEQLMEDLQIQPPDVL